MDTSLQNMLFLACCILLLMSSLYFVFNPMYHDGIFGRAALLGVSAASLVVGGNILLGESYHAPNDIGLLIVAFAQFMVWHSVRFYLRCKKKTFIDDRRRVMDRRWHAENKEEQRAPQ